MKKLFIISSILILFLFTTNIALASSEVSGYAWSSNIGWISFKGSNYGVEIDSATGLFSGYAWSSNIGWITFNDSDLVLCPSAPCNASVDLSNCIGNVCPVSGWARTYRAIEPEGNTLGEWTGWIKLDGASIDRNESPIELTGYAWGGGGINEDSAVIGWISFNCENNGSCGVSDYKVIVDVIGDPPSADNLSASFIYGCGTNPTINFSFAYQGSNDLQAIEIKATGGGETTIINRTFNPPLSSGPVQVDNSSLDFGTNYNWTLKLFDTEGSESGEISGNPFSSYRWPRVNFTCNEASCTTPATFDVGADIQFNSISTCYNTLNNETSCSSYNWDFGDTTFSTLQNPTKSYSAEDNYNIRHTVTDPSDNSCDREKTIDVGDVSPARRLPRWREVIPF